jgi:hypothetical protein
MPRIQGLDLDCDNAKSEKVFANRPNVGATLRFADAGSRSTTGGVLAARLSLFVMSRHNPAGRNIFELDSTAPGCNANCLSALPRIR